MAITRARLSIFSPSTWGNFAGWVQRPCAQVTQADHNPQRIHSLPRDPGTNSTRLEIRHARISTGSNPNPTATLITPCSFNLSAALVPHVAKARLRLP